MSSQNIKVALIGNPNTGKTSVFNLLTGLHQQVGNYPGITVEKKLGICNLPLDFKATILEVKKIEGMGTTIDIILVNGTLNLDDKILLSGFDGIIDTTVKAVLTPHPMKEMRVKN